MAGIGGIGGMPGMGGAGGANPLSGLGGTTNGLGSGGLSGMADMGLGLGDGGDAGQGGGAAAGIGPAQPASQAQGAAFGDTLRSMVIDKPSESKRVSGEMATRFAMGDKSIDPHTLSIASAKAGVEIQMATRTISSAVSAVRTLFQMQV